LSVRDKLWIVLLATLVVAQFGVSLFMPRGDALTIANDLIQTALLLTVIAAFYPNLLRSRYPSRRIRLFWMLMTAGILFWLTYQGMWNYFEVVRRRDVPDPFAGDVVLFLHLVPMMAALALAPHQQQDERDARISMLDFALLLTWWLFLYVYAVIPWQYVHVNEAIYSNNFNQVYLTEKLVLLVALTLLVQGAEGGWRHLYAQLLGASALYASSSYVANWAIGHQIYYSGSIYDIPLTVSIAWIAVLGKFAPRYSLNETTYRSQSPLGVWVTRFGMVAVFSLPWFALHSQLDAASPLSIKKFRIALSLFTMIVMGIMVFWRQNLLAGELSHLLESSRRSYEDLKTLQGQLLQSEKLASLGRLVGGAAHEINNPLTAMLGYSDLLSASPMQPAEERQATRISEQVRRTKTLVASLLTFARQAPANLAPIDLNSVLQTALRLLQPQLETQGVTTRMELGVSLPPILADSNQLLQVCMHLAGQTSSRLHAQGSSVLHVQTRQEASSVVLEFTGGAFSSPPPDWASRTSEEADPKTLSLSACRRIVEEHGGRILSRRSPDGHLDFRLELPAAVKGERSGNAAGITAAASTTS
jgi:signal transduction histidine kinase